MQELAPMLRAYKASVFQALSYPIRIAILEVLRDKELSANAIQEQVGFEQTNLADHLAILRSRGVLGARKDGAQMLYSVQNKALIAVLDLMREHFQTHLGEAAEMLRQIETEKSSADPQPRAHLSTAV